MDLEEYHRGILLFENPYDYICREKNQDHRTIAGLFRYGASLDVSLDGYKKKKGKAEGKTFSGNDEMNASAEFIKLLLGTLCRRGVVRKIRKGGSIYYE